jgi:hypothetical protein
MHAETQSTTVAAIAAYNLNVQGTGAALFAKKVGNIGFAGFFDGDVHVTRNITCDGDVAVTGADCAEEFAICGVDVVVPGSVMVAVGGDVITPCESAYDRRAVGVVSGAGEFRPGLVLDKQTTGRRLPIALVGRVNCLVDAAFGEVLVGDLLTTSTTPGHAMRADSTAMSVGTVIGKALSDLKTGRGLVQMLVTLQ